MYDVFEGVRVVEVATWVFVPIAGAVCADWGADVIKIEHPVTGDPQRGLYVSALGPGAPDLMMQQPNRGKRSVALDIRHPSGHEALMRLVSTADVFLTNFLPATRRALRIEPEDVHSVNPRVVYALGTGHGTRGPERDLGGYDSTSAWSRSGMAFQMAHGGTTDPPRFPPAMIDSQAGLTLAGGIAAALFRRVQKGVGATVDVSLLSVASWMMAPDILASEYGGDMMPSRGRHDPPVNPLVNTYRTGDGRWLYLSLLQSDRYWIEFCERIGRPDLAIDERYLDSNARSVNRVACVKELDEHFGSRPLAHWREVLHGMSGPWCAMQTPNEVRSDPQVVANEMLASASGPRGDFRLVASPLQFDESALSTVTPAPEWGEHTDEVLREVGYTDDELLELKLSDAIL